MGLKLARYRNGREIQWGLVKGDQISPIASGALSTSAAIEHAQKASTQRANKRRISIGKVQWLSPITAPCQILCQGKNYVEHIRETGLRPQDKAFNLFFQKASSSLTGAHAAIRRPPGVRLLDYEVELGLVIGRRIDRPVQITADNLHNYVAGWVLANDISARDIQVPQGQWFKGKSFRNFCPAGPWIFLPSTAERSRLPELELNLRVNGERRQHSRVEQMIYSPAETLTELSAILDLQAGDMILTGTPSGVAMRVRSGWPIRLRQLFRSPRKEMASFIEDQASSGRYLRNGDVIHASIGTADGAIDLGMQELRINDD